MPGTAVTRSGNRLICSKQGALDAMRSLAMAEVLSRRQTVNYLDHQFASPYDRTEGILYYWTINLYFEGCLLNADRIIVHDDQGT